MGRVYSQDLRQRVLADCDNGLSSEDVARKYSVAIATVYSWRKQRRETGTIAPKEYQRGQRPKLEPHEKTVRQLVAEHPDATLEELHSQLPNKDEVTVVTLHNFLKRLKITWKKRRFVLPNNAKNGKNFKRPSPLKSSFSSTKHGRKRT
jgi:transposase